MLMNNSLHLKISLLMNLLERQSDHTRSNTYLDWKALKRDMSEPDAIYCDLLKANVRMCNFVSCTFYKKCKKNKKEESITTAKKNCS